MGPKTEDGLELKDVALVEPADLTQADVPKGAPNSASDDVELGGIDCLCRPSKPSSESPVTTVLTWLTLNKQQIMSGLTVALAQVPEAVAFSLVAGVEPLVGLQAAWIMGVVTSVFGGRPGMISGATGAVAVVMVDLVADEGVEYLFFAIMFAGVLQLIFGALGGGALVRMIPHPVMVGFCNGLAIVIGLAQFNSFKAVGHEAEHRLLTEYVDEESERRLSGAFGAFTNGVPWVDSTMGAFMAIHVVVAMGVTHFLPRVFPKFPSSLAAIIITTAIEWVVVRNMGFKTNTVEDIAIVKGNFPIPVFFDSKYDMPPLNGDTIGKVAYTGTLVAAIGLIESLMTLNLINDLTNTKGSPNREALGQGLAQFLAGLFGGMGGCAMIGQSMINVKSGGTTRLSGAVAGTFLLLVILVAYPLINLIPTAALAGVMFMVCYYTFEWHSVVVLASSSLPLKWRQHEKIKSDSKVNRSDALVVVLVMGVTLAVDLAVAVIAGIVFSALVFSWNSGGNLAVERSVPEGDGKTVVYDVEGSLFFASVAPFVEGFTPKSDPDIVQINFTNCDIYDWSAIEAINALAEKYEGMGKEVMFSKIKVSSKKIIAKARDLTSESLRAVVEDVSVGQSHAIGEGWAERK